MYYQPMYSHLWARPGPRCGHRQRRSGERIPLDCARDKDHEGDHLHDVPLQYQSAQRHAGADPHFGGDACPL